MSLGNDDGIIDSDNEMIVQGFEEFGIKEIEFFRNNDSTFLFPYGDFTHQYFNDTDRKYAALSSNEFETFLNYLISVYSAVLQAENVHDYIDDAYIKEYEATLKTAAFNIRLKELIETNSLDYLENSFIKDGYKIFSGFSRDVYLDGFIQIIYICLQLKKALKGNEYAIVTLIY